MAIRFIRKPSDTPNVSNADDTRLFRYALGDYNGYIKGKGAELAYSINGSIFKINSGVVVLQGYDVEIDANGWELTVDNVATKRYFSVYLEINLATQTADIKSMYDTAGYPTVSSGDDLTASPTGTARMLLYQLTAQNGVISEVSKKVTEIKYSKTLIETEATAIRNDLMSGSLVAKIAQYASSDTEKGTIEERLTKLGFRSGSVSLSIPGYGSMGNATLTRQGNYVIVRLNIFNAKISATPSGEIGTLPENFRPASSQTCRIGGLGRLYTGVGSPYQVSCRYDLTISLSGVMSITTPFATIGDPPVDRVCSLHQTTVSIGFEARPITT